MISVNLLLIWRVKLKHGDVRSSTGAKKEKKDTLLYHSNPVQSPLYKQYSRRKDSPVKFSLCVGHIFFLDWLSSVEEGSSFYFHKSDKKIISFWDQLVRSGKAERTFLRHQSTLSPQLDVN